MAQGLADTLRRRDVLSVELRPPRIELDAAAVRDAWIDTHHAVRGFVRDGRYVFLTDGAVGTREEHNLRHLVANLGTDVPRDRVVPFLTTKHTLEYCLSYAERAWNEGFRSLVVLGGDRTVGPPRCVGHAWELRKLIREQVPDLALGGWANPHADAATQVGYLADGSFYGEYFLTQVASHHDMPKIEKFLDEYARRGVTLPAVFGVFYYRSANAKTLGTLRQFLPVPIEPLTKEFESGASPEEVCARTIRALRSAGVRHLYVSNLPLARARSTLETILDLADGKQR
jgi:5,10-methylenetetrahydrofolate reductase